MTLFPAISIGSSDQIVPGDQIFVQGRVIGCGVMIRNVEVADIQESGQVVLFEDIELEVAGKTTDEVAEMVKDVIEVKSGHRPTSIRVVRVPDEDIERRVMMMLEVARLKFRGCGHKTPPTEQSEWELNLHHIAMNSHNKSLNPHALKRAG